MSGNNAVAKVYLSPDGDEDQVAEAEEILGNAITYFKGLLEDPNIWISDMIGYEPLKQDQENLEEFLE